MIKTKEDLKDYIKADNIWYSQRNHKIKIIDRISSHNGIIIKKYLKYLRKTEYHLNNSAGNRLHTYLFWYYEGRKNRLGRKIGIEIYPNCFEKGLNIWHCGGIVVHPDVRVGENCILHGGNCIGNKGVSDVFPVLGNNVELGYGASIIGDVFVADNTIIGVNAVIVKSISKQGTTVVGVPAHEIV